MILFVSVIAEHLPIRSYTVAEGLPRDFVGKIKQDSRGFFWFCTPGGVSRFDGYAFTNFTIADGLPDRHINDLLETRGGEIWVATDAGLAKLSPRGIRAQNGIKESGRNGGDPIFSVYLPANPKSAHILALYETRAGQIYAGTSDGLYRLNSLNELELVSLVKPTGDFLEITTILEDRNGNLWIGTYENALLRLLPDGRVEQFTMTDGLPGKNIETMLEDKDGRIWVGMRAGLGAGLCLLVAEPKANSRVVERRYTTKDGLPDDWVLSLLLASDGQMWVGTTRGLCKWQGEGSGDPVCKTYTAKNDLTDTEVWALAEDKDGNLWTGTSIGVKRLARYGFTAYSNADGIDSPFLNSIFENPAGDLFVSADTGGTRTISRFNGERFDMIRPSFPPAIEYFGSGNRQTVRQTRTGEWWFPSGAGLFRFAKPARLSDLEKETPEMIKVGGAASEVSRFFEDSRGDLWISTTYGNHGLWRWDRSANVWHEHTIDVGFNIDRTAIVFAEDTNGHLWIGTSDSDNSLIRFNYADGQFKIFTKADGLPPGPANDLYVDRSGALWVAKPTVGLLKLVDLDSDHLSISLYSSAEGLSTQGAMCVTEDKFGRIYVGTGRGLDRLSPDTGQIENFTTADGLPNSAPQLAFRDRNGNLWFATPGGLARFVPEPPRVREPPRALITGVRISGVPQAVSVLGESAIALPDLDSDQKQVTIEFLGLGINLGEKLRYEYRFGGSEWTSTNERTVNFANLAAGEYQFEVRALSADRLYSLAATVDFKISAPIWQRWWFILFIITLLAGFIYLIYKSRLRRLVELEKVRTRIATDLHDDIGANLTRISLLSEVAKQSAGNGTGSLLTSIADIARESVASMNDIVWAISPDHDSLLDLTRRMRQHADEVFTSCGINLAFDAPASDVELKLSVGVRRDLLLLFKEAVNNAAKHSACSYVSVKFSRKNSRLILSIVDNGKGFKTDAINEGQGLRSMSRRAAALGGTLVIDSSGGTSIVFEMDLPFTRSSV